MSASATAVTLRQVLSPSRSRVSESPRERCRSRPGSSERVTRESSIAKASKPLSCSTHRVETSACHPSAGAKAARKRSVRSS
jgi:hypothetical protein